MRVRCSSEYEPPPVQGGRVGGGRKRGPRSNIDRARPSHRRALRGSTRRTGARVLPAARADGSSIKKAARAGKMKTRFLLLPLPACCQKRSRQRGGGTERAIKHSLTATGPRRQVEAAGCDDLLRHRYRSAISCGFLRWCGPTCARWDPARCAVGSALTMQRLLNTADEAVRAAAVGTHVWLLPSSSPLSPFPSSSSPSSPSLTFRTLPRICLSTSLSLRHQQTKYRKMKQPADVSA